MATTTISTPPIAAPTHTTPTGFAGFSCELTDQPVPVQECLACAQEGAPGCPMTPALLERIAAGIRPLNFSQRMAASQRADFGISVTELISCPRRFRLQRETAYYERPTSLARAQRGTARHADLALYTGPGLKELRISWTFSYTHPDGRKIRVSLSGQPDILTIGPAGWVITDYKDTDNPPRPKYTYTCSIHPEVIAGEPHWRGRGPFTCPHCGTLSRSQVDETITPPIARETHALQIHLLALLVTKNLAPLAREYNQARLRHPDWTTPPAAEDTPIAGGEIAYLGLLRCPVIPDVPAALAHLKRRLSALLSHDLPPILSNPDEVWACTYCPVRAACEQRQVGP